MASWLVRSTPARLVRVRVLAGDIVLCSWARRFTLTHRLGKRLPYLKYLGYAIMLQGDSQSNVWIITFNGTLSGFKDFSDNFCCPERYSFKILTCMYVFANLLKVLDL